MSTTLILACLLFLALGTVAGFVLARSLHPQEQQRKELESQLEKTRSELNEYQQAVTTHFMDTSAKVNSLTESYRSLHEHLASGAMQLTNPEISRQLIEAGYGKLSPQPSTTNSAIDQTPEPPKDYAPASGVLSESYGLKEEKTEPAIYPESLSVANDADLEDQDPTLKTG